MKLLYAGVGLGVKPFTDLLFNCTRNQKCERPFYVPVNMFSDISLFADLPGSPTLVQIEVLNVCDIANIGAAIPGKYVIGKKPDGTWYGVFSNLIVTPPVGVTYNRFFFKLSLTIGGQVYVWYSQQYEFPYCETLTMVRGCYPNEEIGVDATDCNGIYYGYPNNEDFLGDPLFRYIHKAFVRLGSVIEQSNKMTFTAFLNRKTYKSVFVRESLFESEIVPKFYKDVMIGIYNRGNIQIDSVEWKLAESQDIRVIDNDSKLWRVDVTLDSECKQTFGCKPMDCALKACCDPVVGEATVQTIPDPPEPVCNRYTNTHVSESAVDVEYIDCNGDPQTDTLTPGAIICAFEITDPGTGGTLTIGMICDGPAPCCNPVVGEATSETTAP